MNIYQNSIGVEVSPSALRIARLISYRRALNMSVLDEVRLPYKDFDDLYRHAKECGDALNKLCQQNNIQSGRCIATLPAARGKTKSIALPLMPRRALSRMLSSRHFWYKHLGVNNDSYSYAWLVTVHDKKQYRLSLYLMAVPTDDIAFYKAMFARTSLSLNVLTLSTLVYYGIHRQRSAARVLVINEDEAYLAHFGLNVFTHQTVLSEHDHLKLFKEDDKKPADVSASSTATNTALQHLSETLQERLRSEKGDTHTLWVASHLSPQAIAQLDASLKDISLKPLDVCRQIRLAPQLQNNPATMDSVIALTRWFASDSALFKKEANFINNHNAAYYKSAACWTLSAVVSAMLFFYYQHLTELNLSYLPDIQYQTQLALEHSEYQKKLKVAEQRSAHRQRLHERVQFLSQQHHFATELWSQLGALIPPSVAIETIDCQWQSACLITAQAQSYGQIISFAEHLKQLDAIAEVVISNSRVAPGQSSEAMQFTLECSLNNAVLEQMEYIP